MSNLPYHEKTDRDNILHLRQLLQELPQFCSQYFRGIEPRTSSRTRIAYAYDLKIFFEFLLNEHPNFHQNTIKEIQLEELDELHVSDIEEYMEYLKYRFNEISEKYGSTGIPIQVIDQTDYGMMNGKKVLKSAIKLMKSAK